MTAVAFGVHGMRYTVRFRYDAAIVAMIKNTVPSSSRSWDAGARCWYGGWR